MRTTLRTALLISASVLGNVAMATAQDPAPARAAEAARGLVPVHTGVDEAEAAYGIWAAGPDYKVSFHDGMTFYPVLGEAAPRNLPVRWTTTSVAVGEQQMLTPDAKRAMRGQSAGWRYEYRYPGFTEAYDVREDGVEQTFVFDRRPGTGDLVVRGRLDGELGADASGAGAGGLALRDAGGREVVHYGAAVAVDAVGRRTAMATRLVDGEIELRLDASAVRDVVFPLTVDPLISTRGISAGGAPPAKTEIARDGETGQLMIVFTRAVSSADYDAYAYMMDDDFSPSAPVFTDITASWSTDSIDAAFVAAPAKWLIGFNRLLPASGVGYLRAHVHDAGDFSIGTRVLALSTAEWAHEIAVGGCSSSVPGDEAIIVYRWDRGQPNSPTSTIRGTVVDVRAATRLRDFQISSGDATEDAERPDVNEQRQGSSDDWYCVFQSLDAPVAQDDWDLLITRADDFGAMGSWVALGNQGATMHSFAPRIAGSVDRYAISYLQRPNLFPQIGDTGPEAWAQIIQWGVRSAQLSVGAHQLVRQGSALRLGGVAFDSETRSHWSCVTSEQLATPLVSYVDRVGRDGRVAESATISSTKDRTNPSVTYDDDNHEYTIAYASSAVVLASKFAYPALAPPSPYGSGCGAASIGLAPGGHGRLPWAGTANFILRLSGAQSGVNAVLFLGGAPGSFDLSPIGMTGCRLLVDPSLGLGTIGMAVTSSGQNLRLSIPSRVKGTVYAQWFYVSPGANPFGAEMTDGLAIDIQ
ncbi:MAG: hypothetical protein AAF628_25270 [Planctomycetota bacterium]